MDFKELYIRFTKEGHKDTLNGTKYGYKIIMYRHMVNLLKKCNPYIIYQFNDI